MGFWPHRWSRKGRKEVEDAVDHIEKVVENEITKITDPQCGLQQAIAGEIREELKEITKPLAIDDDLAPEEILLRDLGALDRCERQYFVVTNMIEAVKGGKNLKETIDNLQKCGASKIKTERLGNARDESRIYAFLRGVLGVVLKVARGIIRTIMAILKELSKRIKWDNAEEAAKAAISAIRPNVGVAGAFPTLSFSFDWKSIELEVVWNIIEAALVRD